MVGLLIFGVLVWVIMQGTSERNQRKWKRRYVPVAPIVRHVRADAAAMLRDVRAHREYRREKRRANWDITEVL